jgi:hypothetical protein
MNEKRKKISGKFIGLLALLILVLATIIDKGVEQRCLDAKKSAQENLLVVWLTTNNTPAEFEEWYPVCTIIDPNNKEILLVVYQRTEPNSLSNHLKAITP